jgi:hypothetical protein
MAWRESAPGSAFRSLVWSRLAANANPKWKSQSVGVIGLPVATGLSNWRSAMMRLDRMRLKGLRYSLLVLGAPGAPPPALWAIPPRPASPSTPASSRLSTAASGAAGQIAAARVRGLPIRTNTANGWLPLFQRNPLFLSRWQDDEFIILR